MEQAYSYIKRILSFLLCCALLLAGDEYIPLYLLIPLLLLTFSLLHYRITLEKPPHLFAFYRTESFFKKGGLRDLLRIFVTVFGFLYDVILWTVWGVYLVFMLFIDLLDFIKTIVYWIIHAIIWILRQFVPFLVFLYHIIVHYLIKWIWWLYQIAYYNIRFAFNSNCVKAAMSGTLIAFLIVFVFYYLQTIILDLEGLIFIGIVISLLPLTWSFGEIANIRARDLENEKYRTIRHNYQNGIEAVRSVLFYVTMFVVLLLAQLGLNLLGWVQDTGIVIIGVVFNVNTLISLILIFLCIIIVFGVVIIPSFRLYVPFIETKFSHSLILLKMIARKAIQYIIVSLPAALFSFIVIIIPFCLIVLAGAVTYYLKNVILDLRIDQIKTEQTADMNHEFSYLYTKRVEHLENLKTFPLQLVQEVRNRTKIDNELATADRELKRNQEELLRNADETKRRIGEMDHEMASLDPSGLNYARINVEKERLTRESKAFENSKQAEINKLQTDISFLNLKQRQFPLLVFLGGIWAVIFGGLVFAFAVSYLGNVFHQVYIFRNDEQPTEWRNIVNHIREKDSRQPLLGATFFILLGLIIVFLIAEGFLRF